MADKWISVKDDLPGFDERVFITIAPIVGNPYVEIGLLIPGSPPHWLWLMCGKDNVHSMHWLWLFDKEQVTHWRPFPKPAKE